MVDATKLVTIMWSAGVITDDQMQVITDALVESDRIDDEFHKRCYDEAMRD